MSLKAFVYRTGFNGLKLMPAMTLFVIVQCCYMILTFSAIVLFNLENALYIKYYYYTLSSCVYLGWVTGCVSRVCF